MTITLPANMALGVHHTNGTMYLFAEASTSPASMDIKTGTVLYSILSKEILPLLCPYKFSQNTMKEVRIYFGIHNGDVYIKPKFSSNAFNLKTGVYTYVRMADLSEAPHQFHITVKNKIS